LNRDDRMRTLLELRNMLKTRIEELEEELARLRSMLDALDDVLLEATITTADRLPLGEGAPREIRPAEAVEGPPSPAEVEEREILSGEERIGRILVNRGRGILVVEVEEGVKADSSPIRWLRRRLREFERISSGAAYNVEVEEGLLKRVVVSGVPESEIERLVKEIRWALDRAHRNP